MSLSYLCKSLLPISWKGAAGLITRTIASSSVFHAVSYIYDVEEYEKIVKNAEKPIVVSFYNPLSSKSEPQYDCVQEVMTEKEKIDLAHVAVTIPGVLEEMEPEDLGALPLLAVFRNGKISERLSGPISKESLSAWLDEVYTETHLK